VYLTAMLEKNSKANYNPFLRKAKEPSKLFNLDKRIKIVYQLK
jgi:hypothetical protein